MNIALTTVALALFAGGMVFDIGVGVGRRLVRPLPYVAGSLGSLCLLIVGVRSTLGTGQHHLDHLLGLSLGGVFFDPLAGLFLTLLFSLSIVICGCSVSWVRRAGSVNRRGTAAAFLAVLGSAAVIILASNAFLFLFAWESLTVAFYGLTSIVRSSPGQPRPGWLTGGIGRLSGAALLLGFLLLAAHAHSLGLAAWSSVSPGALKDVAWCLIVVGFGAKVGLIPFEAWLPAGYSAAPGPSRALMAGVAANVGFYGLWRVLGVLGRPPVWLDVCLLVVAGATALLGITFAGVQQRLSRLVAYSSVENAGLILTAFGVAMAGASTGRKSLEALGLLAASLQMVAHAIAKSTLFCSLANLETACGSDDLEQLRGAARTLKWSGASFSAGALALAGLPPALGFVSEWFILEALLQQFRLPGLELPLALAAAGAATALTTGLAALAFLRVIGLVILGPRSGASGLAGGEAGLVGRASLALLGTACIGLAGATPWEVRYLAHGLSPVVSPQPVLGALKSPWVLQPVFSGFSILSPTWLWVAMPAAVVVTLGTALVFSRGRFLRVRRVAPWHSATSPTLGPADYSAFAFANPLRHVLGNLLGTRRLTERAHEQADDDEVEPPLVVTYTVVVEPVETYVYKPLTSLALWAATTAKRLQSGQLNAYVAYMFVALLAALALTAALR